MNKAIVYRILPDKEQKEQCIKTFGCGRFVYNRIFDEQKRLYAEGEKRMGREAANHYCNHVLKAEYPWLREVDKFALTNAVFHMDDAYVRFFEKKSGFPKHKSLRHSRASYTTNFTNNNIAIGDGCVKLPKLGRVKAKLHRMPKKDWVIKSATVSMDRCGRFCVSILFYYEEDIPPALARETIGLDYKSDGFYTSSEGETLGSPKYFRRKQKRRTEIEELDQTESQSRSNLQQNIMSEEGFRSQGIVSDSQRIRPCRH